MKTLISTLIFFSALTSLNLASAQPEVSRCKTTVAVSSASIQTCHNLSDRMAIPTCLNKALASKSEITLRKDSRLFRAKYLQQANATCVVFDSWVFKTPVALGYRTEDGVPFAEGSSIRISAGGIEFNGYFCGWDSDGKFRRTLASHYRFIPDGTAVKTILPKCVGKMQVDATAVTLSSRTIICNMALSAETSFGYAPDDQYHFTALNDGTMKGTDRRGKPIDIPIKNGKDYRNADPAEHPCAWEETPEEVLKSFTEEHSE